MRHNPRASYLLAASAVLTVGLFTALGASTLFPMISNGTSAAHLERNATTDAFLAVLALPHPTVTIENAVQSYGEDTTLLFVATAKEPFSTQIYYTISYLAYPRRISAVYCEADPNVSPEDMQKFPDSTNLDGLIFFNRPAGRWAAGAQQLGAKLSIAPHKGPASWRFFCR